MRLVRRKLTRYWLVAERMGTGVHVLGALTGMLVMALGSSIALNGHTIVHALGIWHLPVDMVAYGLHGFGAIPIYRHGEHLWNIFTLEEVVRHANEIHEAEVALMQDLER
jgi:hypothetical protein